ncbi:MAG: hypothetical protein LBP63_01740 [Prevotellaceae bacterium]|jgi:hypothetical protein|nr:hypothetical protein [Prevotellaceae bacterium]
MKKLTSLMILIESLSKAEKRYFRLFSNLQSGDKKYVYLFDLIVAHNSIDAVYTQFCKKYNSANFNITVKHLYQTVMDCLIYLHRKMDIQTKIFALISEANILFERALTDESMKTLKKAKTMALTYEIYPMLIFLRRTELEYLNATNFENISERQLVSKQMKIMEDMKYNRSSNLHSQLYDILKHRLFYKGYAKSEKQKQSLNDLILSELNIVANNSYKGFETQKLHLLFQATYYLDSGNYKMAIRFYQTLIDMFEANKHMILNPPIYYLQAITGILNSLKLASLYGEMPFFINKLKMIEQGAYADDFILNIRAFVFLYEFSCAFNTGNFTAAADLTVKYNEDLFKNMSLLRLEMQLDILIDLTVLDMAAGNIKNARKHMKTIMSSGKLFYVLPAYRYARLINLILQAESENYDFFENEIKSIKRSIRSEKHLYITEKLLFRFIQNHYLLNDKKVREKLKRQFEKEVAKIKQNKYEQQLLVVFDFISWMQSKLTNRRLDDILAEKNCTRSII